ncbi:DUF4007 family protein [Halieaceae bacterium]|nr:DUF4007 family protein [Halieaceae bacterium]
MSKYNPSITSFGRHETFGLRYAWLPKGCQAVSQTGDIKVFHRDDATVTLGVGKNMVASIRYWIVACGLLDGTTGLETELGKNLLDPDTGFDPYLEDEGSLWLIHWLLASNPNRATSFFWFFNKFHKTDFTQDELLSALRDWVRDNVSAKVAISTLKSDASLLPRMYSNARAIGRLSLEDALDNPLAELGLLTSSASGRAYQSRLAARSNLPVEILGFAVFSVMKARAVKILPVEELMYGRDNYCAPGAVFRLTESDLIAKLETLVSTFEGALEIRDSAGINQLYLEAEPDPMYWLRQYYNTNGLESAA